MTLKRRAFTPVHLYPPRFSQRLLHTLGESIMETLNYHYLTAADASPDQPVSPYTIFLRAHLRQGYYATPEVLRCDISARVPPLARLSYREHIIPLVAEHQGWLEDIMGLSVRAVDVEVQYRPRTASERLGPGIEKGSPGAQ